MSTPFSIRLLRLSDLDRIMEIERASFGDDAYDRNLFAGFYHKCGELFLVAVRRRNVCGYMLTCPGGKAAPARAELVSVAVDPRQRGKGIASALMDSTLRRLRRRGIARFHLMVKVTNQPAIAFYERYGFIRSRIVRQYYEDGADAWRMARRCD
jgi:ribosomal-protein-alanine N-acetyltransferase